jgi:alpha/beta superfamily hydrolase
MPRVYDLPEPPANPVRSPEVWVPGETRFTLPGLPGQPALEAAMRLPRDAKRGVVLCHPHPLYGGTMHSAVILAIAKVLAELAPESTATLRFNYRGVPGSQGAYEKGLGEVNDVRAAIRELRANLGQAAPITLVGFSFGTWVGLRGAAEEGGIERVGLIAPAVRIFTFVREDAARFEGRLAMYLGTEDDFCSVEEAQALASDLGASLELFEGFEHYFLKGRRRLAERVVRFAVPELGLVTGEHTEA